MSEFLEVIDGPLQKAGEYWQRASEIMAAQPEPVKVSTPDGEDHFWVSPEVKPIDVIHRSSVVTATESRILSQNYRIAARVSGKRHTSSDELFLIINGNFANPVLKFNRYPDTLQYLDTSISDVADAHKYVPGILESIKKKTAEKAVEKAEAKIERKRSIRSKVIGTFVVGALVAGTIKIVDTIHDYRADNQREREALINYFDSSFVSLTGSPIAAGEIDFIESSGSIVHMGIPGEQRNDTFDHPRKVELGNSDCEHVTKIDPSNEQIIILTNVSRERLMGAVTTNGEVQVCYFGGRTTADTEEAEPMLAVQVVSNQSS